MTYSSIDALCVGVGISICHGHKGSDALRLHILHMGIINEIIDITSNKEILQKSSDDSVKSKVQKIN